MPNPNNVKALYDELQSTYNLGSYDDFLNYLSDEKNREALRKELSEEYEVGDIAQFSEYLGFGTGPAALEQFKHQTEGNKGTPNYVPNRFGLSTQQGVGPVAPTANAQATPTPKPQPQQDGTQYNYMPMGSIQSPAANQPAYTPQRKPMAPAPRAGQWSGAPMQQTPYAPTEAEGDLSFMPIEQGEDTKARYDAAKQAVGGQGGQVQSLRESIIKDIEGEQAKVQRVYNPTTRMYTDTEGRPMGIATDNMDDMATTNIRMMDLQAAKRSLDNSQKMIDEANAGNKNFFASAGRGMRDRLFDPSMWDFGITDLTDQAAIMRALDAYDKGGEEALSDSQRKLLDAKAVELATTAYFGSELGRGYKAGQVTAEAIPFMLEMAINPAAGIGKGASKAMVRYALKKFGKEAIQKGGKRYVAKQAMKYGTRIALDPAGAGLMAVSTGAARTAADALDRMAGNLHYDTDAQGNITFDGHTDAESWVKAFGKAFASTTIENYSEMLGKYFGPALGLLGKGASKVGKGIARTKAGAAVGRGIDKISGVFENAYNSTFSKNIGLQAVGDFISKVPAGKVAGFLSELEKRAQWHGVMGEYTEEIAGGLLNALVVGDQTLDTDKDTGVFNLDNNIDTFLGVALMGGFFSGAKTVGYGVERAYNARQFKKANRMGVAAFGDGWADVQAAIESDPKAGAGAVLKDRLSTKEQREAVLRYAAAVTARQGMEQGKAKRDAEGVQTKQEAAAEQSYNTSYEDATTDELRSDINMAYTDARQKLVELIGEDNVSVIDEDPLGMQRLYDNDPNVSDEVTMAVAEYVSAKSAWDGVQQRISDDAADRADQRRAEGERMAYKVKGDMQGMLRPLTINEESSERDPETGERKKKTVYLVNGTIAIEPNGNGLSREGTDKTIYVYDPETGETHELDPFGGAGVLSVGNVVRMEDYLADNEQQSQAEVQQEIDNATGKVNVAPNTPFVTPEGRQGIVKSVEGGNVIVQFADGEMEEASIPLADMQQYADALRRQEYEARHPQQTAAEQPQQPITAVEQVTLNLTPGAKVHVSEFGETAEVVSLDEDGKNVTVRFEDGNETTTTKDMLQAVEEAYRGHMANNRQNSQPQQPNTATEGQTPTEGGNAAEDTRTPAQRTYDDMTAKYGEKASHKVDVTLKDRKATLDTKKRALDKAQTDYDDAPIGKEDKAEAALAKAQEEYDNALADYNAWDEVRKLRDQALLAQAEHEEQQRKAELERKRAAETEAQRKQREEYEAEQARRREQAERLRQEDAERLKAQIEKEKQEQSNPQPNEPAAPIEGTKGSRSQLAIASEEMADNPEALAMLDDLEPRSLDEIAATLLGGGKRGVKLQREEFKRHTGYSEGEMKRYPFIFASKENGGVTIERLGEMVANEAVNENIPFDDLDAMAGANAVLDMLSSVYTQGDINNYIQNKRIAEAREYYNKVKSEAYAMMLDAYGMTEGEYESYMSWLEDAIEQGKSTLSDEEFNQLFNVYEQGQETDVARGNQEGAATTERTESAETDVSQNGERGNGEADAGTGEQAAISKYEEAESAFFGFLEWTNWEYGTNYDWNSLMSFLKWASKKAKAKEQPLRKFVREWIYDKYPPKDAAELTDKIFAALKEREEAKKATAQDTAQAIAAAEAETDTNPTEGEKEAPKQEPKPIGRGVFGDIYDQFKGRVKEAFDFLIRHKSGDLLGVFHRDEIGDIDLVWGDKGGGIDHIIDKHVGEGKSFATTEEAIVAIEDIINNGEKAFENGDKIVFKVGDKQVTIRKNYREKGKKIADKNWVLTAYDELSADSGSPAATNQDKAGNVAVNSSGKNTKNFETDKEKIIIGGKTKDKDAGIRSIKSSFSKEGAAFGHRVATVDLGSLTDHVTVRMTEEEFSESQKLFALYTHKVISTAELSKRQRELETRIRERVSRELDEGDVSSIVSLNGESVEVEEQKKQSVGGFVSGMSKMQRGRVEKTLNERFRYEDGGVMTRAEHVERLVSGGAVFGRHIDNKGKVVYSIEGEGGIFVPITKTEYDYAVYLGGKVTPEEEIEAERDRARYKELVSKYEYPTPERIDGMIKQRERILNMYNANGTEGRRAQEELAELRELKDLKERMSAGKVRQQEPKAEKQEPKLTDKETATLEKFEALTKRANEIRTEVGQLIGEPTQENYDKASDEVKGKVDALLGEYRGLFDGLPKDDLLTLKQKVWAMLGEAQEQYRQNGSKENGDALNRWANLDTDINKVLRDHYGDKNLYMGGIVVPFKEEQGENTTEQPRAAVGGKEEQSGKAAKVSAKERKLRDAVVDLLRKAGIDVVMESEEGQRVLNMANGRGVTLNKAQKRALKTVSISDNQKHRRTVVSSADGAKIQKNLDTLAEKIEKISQTPLRTFIGDLAKALGAEREGSGSEYAFFTTPNGEDVTIRLANHNATVSNFDYRNEDNGISVVIAKSRDTNSGINNDGKAHVVEYYYTETDLRKAFGKPLADIVRSIKGALNSGEFVDTTGLAEREEVNAEQLRMHRVYHGSGADFEAFDHSHMGEGEGGQSFGWGTYVTEVEGIGKKYANDAVGKDSPYQKVEYVGEKTDTESLSNAKAIAPLFNGGSRDWNGVLEFLEQNKENPRTQRHIEWFKKTRPEDWKSANEGKRTLYTVEIPRDNGKNYIDFNAPMISEKLKKAIGDKLKELGFVKIDVGNGRTVYGRGYTRIDLDKSFSSIQDHLGFVLGGGKGVSELLHSAGYVGIKYPADYYNGGNKEGKFNYVIFDDGDLKITNKVKFFRTESGEAYGFTMGGRIYLDPKIATAETPIHEYTHLWAAALRAANPKAWEQLKSELEKDKELVAYVRGLYPELAESNGANGANGLSDELAEEVFAHFSGRRGAERLREEQRKAMDEASDYVEKAGVVAMFEQLRDALKKFWSMARDLFAGKTRGVKSRSAEDFADMVLGDLVGGFKPERGDRVDRSDRERDADIRYQRGGETFEERQRRAVAEKGIVAPGLNGREVTMVEGEKDHGFKTFDEARNWAKENIARTYDNEETGGKGNVRISNTAIDKFLSESSVRQSEDRDIHMSVLKVLPEVIREGVDAEQHPDYKKGKYGIRKTDNGYNDNVLIHRVYGAVSIDGNTYRVKVTLKEEGRNDDPTKAYSYEATKIELLDGQSGSPESLPRNSNNSISAAKLLKNIEKSYDKGKKLLDESSSELEDSDVRFRGEEEPVFYSNAMRAVENIKQERATPEQWVKMIEKNGGLKAGEDKWLGLSEWLKGSDAKTLTKGEVLDYIRANEIQVEEVEYGSTMSDKAKKKLEEYNNEFLSEIEELDSNDKSGGEVAEMAFGVLVDRFGDDFENAFELTWEHGRPRLEPQRDYVGGFVGEAKYFLDMDGDEVGQINSTRLSYTTEGLDNKREIVLTVPTIEPWNEHDEVHFGEAGGGRAVAWARFGETTDADGKRVLVIDEIQSNRHQEGREKGYKKDGAQDAVTKANIKRIDAQASYDLYLSRLAKKYVCERDDIYSYANDAEIAQVEEYKKAVENAEEAYEKAYQENKGVPDAPFEKNWHEVAMKRMLRFAAENGYDKVAWTKGEQQAERYDLSKSVKEIAARADGNGNYFIVIEDKDGQELMDYRGAGEKCTAAEVVSLLGKDLGERLMNGAEKTRGEKWSGKGYNPEFYTIREDGLKVGGEGMKGFYDQILPRFMDKYGKKWGVKTGEIRLDGLSGSNGENGVVMHAVDVTDDMRESVMRGQPLFREGEGPQVEYVTYEESLLRSKAEGYTKNQHDAWVRRYWPQRKMDVEQQAERLNLGDRVTVAVNADELEAMGMRLTERDRRSKGWYDRDTGKIVIILQNNMSMDDVAKTLLHEGVGHYGLRYLFGKHFEEFLDLVYAAGDEKIRREIAAIAARSGYNFHDATEEYLSRLAEEEDFERPEQQSWWRQVKMAFFTMLRRIGFKIENWTETITDDELKYVLWRSYQNLKENGAYRDLVEVAEDVAMQAKLKVGAFEEKRNDRNDKGDRTDRKDGDEWSRAAEEAKRHWPDAVVLERAGDYYEVHGEDARKAAKILGLPLVRKSDGSYTVGFPTKEMDTYLPRLVRAGARVAVVDSVKEDAVVYGGEDVEAVNARFNEELQQQIDGTLPKGHVYNMGMPSGVLRSTGFPNVPIELSASHLADKAKAPHHPFSLSKMKGLVNALQEPMAVFAYGDKGKAQNVIVEIQHDGKNYVVGIHFNQKRGSAEVSSIRGLYPKDNHEWLHWIEQGKALYLDKEKIQAIILQQQMISSGAENTPADLGYTDLNSVAKIVKNFENPQIPRENFSENADAEGGKNGRIHRDGEEEETIDDLVNSPAIDTDTRYTALAAGIAMYNAQMYISKQCRNLLSLYGNSIYHSTYSAELQRNE